MLNCWCITWPVGFKRLTPRLDGQRRRTITRTTLQADYRNCTGGTFVRRTTLVQVRRYVSDLINWAYNGLILNLIVFVTFFTNPNQQTRHLYLKFYSNGTASVYAWTPHHPSSCRVYSYAVFHIFLFPPSPSNQAQEVMLLTCILELPSWKLYQTPLILTDVTCSSSVIQCKCPGSISN